MEAQVSAALAIHMDLGVRLAMTYTYSIECP